MRFTAPFLFVARLLRLSGSLLSSQLDQFLEGRFVPNCHIGQYLSIQLDTRQLHTMHELTVGSSGSPACRSDPYDPKPPKVAFPFTAMTIRMGPSVNQGLFSPFVVPVGTSVEAPGRQQNFFMASMFGNAALNSGQDRSPSVVWGP